MSMDPERRSHLEAIYREVAGHYDLAWMSVLNRIEDDYIYGRLRRAMEQHFEGREVSVLDLGCGTGPVMRHGLPIGDYLGIDLSREMIAQANQQVSQERARFVSGDFLSLMIPEQTELVVSLYAMSEAGVATSIAWLGEHLPPDASFFGVFYGPSHRVGQVYGPCETPYPEETVTTPRLIELCAEHIRGRRSLHVTPFLSESLADRFELLREEWLRSPMEEGSIGDWSREWIKDLGACAVNSQEASYLCLEIGPHA